MGFGKGKWKEMVKSRDNGMRKSKLEKNDDGGGRRMGKRRGKNGRRKGKRRRRRIRRGRRSREMEKGNEEMLVMVACTAWNFSLAEPPLDSIKRKKQGSASSVHSRSCTKTPAMPPRWQHTATLPCGFRLNYQGIKIGDIILACSRCHLHGNYRFSYLRSIIIEYGKAKRI